MSETRDEYMKRLNTAINMALGMAQSAGLTGRTPMQCLEGNRDVFEATFGKQITSEAFEHVQERYFEMQS